MQAISASAETPAAPFLFRRTNTIQVRLPNILHFLMFVVDFKMANANAERVKELAEEETNPFSRSLKRSLTVTATWELRIESFSTKDPTKAINAMAACWLLRKSPQ